MGRYCYYTYWCKNRIASSHLLSFFLRKFDATKFGAHCLPRSDSQLALHSPAFHHHVLDCYKYKFPNAFCLSRPGNDMGVSSRRCRPYHDKTADRRVVFQGKLGNYNHYLYYSSMHHSTWPYTPLPTTTAHLPRCMEVHRRRLESETEVSSGSDE